MTNACASIREHLGAYVDGELETGRRGLVARHLAECESCADEQQAIREIGDVLRGGAVTPSDVSLQGLAAGVIGRARAEDAQSWRALFGRAIEDWRWTLVGAGSLGAAVVTVLLVAAIYALGPRPEPEDALVAALNNLRMPADKLFIIATPAGPDQLPQLLQFENGPADPSGEPATPTASSTDSDLALALSQTVVGPDGRLNDLRSMSPTRREHAEALLDEIQLRSAAPPVSWSSRRVNMRRLGFVTSTNVSGKAL